MDEEYIRGLAKFLSDTETLPLSMRRPEGPTG